MGAITERRGAYEGISSNYGYKKIKAEAMVISLLKKEGTGGYEDFDKAARGLIADLVKRVF